MITTIPVPETSPASGYYPSPDAPRGEYNRPPTGSQNSGTLPPHDCQLHYLGEIVGIDETFGPVTATTIPSSIRWWVCYREKTRKIITLRIMDPEIPDKMLSDETKENMIWDAKPNPDPAAPPSFPPIQIPEFFPPGTRQYRFSNFVTNGDDWYWLFERFGETWSEEPMLENLRIFLYPEWWQRNGYHWYENSMGEKYTPCDDHDSLHRIPPEEWEDVVEEKTIWVTHGWCRMYPYAPKTGNLIPVYAAAGALAGDVVCGASGGFGGGGALLLLMAAAAGAAAMSGSSAAAAGRKKQKQAESV